MLTSGSQSKKNASLVPCFPLHALLVALNQTTVDYFSLDVEGFELEVGLAHQTCSSAAVDPGAVEFRRQTASNFHGLEVNISLWGSYTLTVTPMG